MSERFPAAIHREYGWIGSFMGTPGSPETSIASSGINCVQNGYVLCSAGLTFRAAIQIYNNDASGTIYVGRSGVGQNNMMPIGPGTSISLNASSGISIYAFANAALNMRILEVER